MSLILVGLSHRTAPVELREQVDFSTRDVAQAVRELAGRQAGDECVILSTCNRVEIYAAARDAARAGSAIGRFVGEFHRVTYDRLHPHLYTRLDDDAARHLFRVAAGLDSLVVGEPQILGQVKGAYQTAADEHATGPLLNRLFHASFAVGKRVRSETGLGEGAVSVSYAALSLARKIFGDLKGLNALVLGAGEMAKLTAIHLQTQQVRQITVASRTLASADALARRVGGVAVPWSEMAGSLEQADIVLTATGAAEPVLTRERVHAVLRTRRNRPLFIIDIAVPRDVEAAAGELEQVFLYNIDDLEAIVSENLARRAGQLAHAEAIVAEEVDKFVAWLQARGAVPTVVALRQRFEAIRRAELKRLEPKLAGLSPEARARVDDITRLIVEKLLLAPTEQLKAERDQSTIVAYSDALARLFSLTEEEIRATAALRESGAFEAIDAGQPQKRPS
jgi:glutamyl-tRNA reductase